MYRLVEIGGGGEGSWNIPRPLEIQVGIASKNGSTRLKAVVRLSFLKNGNDLHQRGNGMYPMRGISPSDGVAQLLALLRGTTGFGDRPKTWKTCGWLTLYISSLIPEEFQSRRDKPRNWKTTRVCSFRLLSLFSNR